MTTSKLPFPTRSLNDFVYTVKAYRLGAAKYLYYSTLLNYYFTSDKGPNFYQYAELIYTKNI